MNSSRKQILVIDDDTRIRKLLGKYLSDNGFKVSLVRDTMQARDLIKNENFDLLIVDLMLPNEDGIKFTKWIKSSSKIPILILTAMSDSDSRIDGLEAGADDYISKPFEPRELLLRINNILKKSYIINNDDNNCLFGDFNFDFKSMRLKKGEKYIHITEVEAKILKILCQNLTKTVSRDQISKIFGEIDNRTIDVHITRIRKKIEENPKKPIFLQTIRNKGYILHK